MTALQSRVPDYTTNLTTLEAAAVPELERWSGMPQRQRRRRPKVAVVPELGRWSWSIMPKLGVK